MTAFDVTAAFRSATRGAAPHPWQRALAARGQPAAVIDAATGSGKTEGVVFDWLWRRVLSGDAAQRSATPRRLVIALPMRVLVEQTAMRIEAMVEALTHDGLLDEERPIHVTTLIGGLRDDGWTLDPAADQILVATIDMALSRALNRGYGESRALWPIDFGLLNTDTQWVFDEVQLLDVAVATSTQMQGLRERIATLAPTRTTWMSATLVPSWLESVDHPAPGPDLVHGLTAADRAGSLGRRLTAPKQLRRVEVDPADAAAVAGVVRDAHARARGAGEPWLTIALCNTVDRAIELHTHLAAMALDAELVLLHSRFRPRDRAERVARLEAIVQRGGRIVVTTQVIEAGIDLDAAALITELAPWPSLVQRAGRLNRAGARDAARLVWLDPPIEELTDPASLPYSADELTRARAVLRDHDGASLSPDALREIADKDSRLLPAPATGVHLRFRDLLGLFDTGPSLDGDDTDVGQYIRAREDLDVSVAWRSLPAGGPSDAIPAPDRDELCPVPLRERKALVSLEPFRWSYHGARWEQLGVGDLRPGDILLVDAAKGGYTPLVGWTATSHESVPPVPVADAGSAPDADARDPWSVSAPLTISEHTDHVVVALDEILAELDLPAEIVDALRIAARHHDAGKAHPIFQERIIDERAGDHLLAKGKFRRERRVFRHEVASVLVFLAAQSDPNASATDLPVYLIGAHHGKLRLLPRVMPAEPGRRARACLGVEEGSTIPDGEGGIDLGGGVVLPGVPELDLGLFDMGALGRRVWSDRSLDLLEQHGPFTLAYLEALLRAADRRASRDEGQDHGR